MPTFTRRFIYLSIGTVTTMKIPPIGPPSCFSRHKPRPNEYTRHVHTPTPQERTPSPGLSYTSGEHLPLTLPPTRPLSLHSTHTVRVPQPAETTSDDPSDDAEVTPRPPFASPAPRRVASRSVLAGAPPISASTIHSQIHTPSPHQMVPATDPGSPPPEAIGSPMSIRPTPTKRLPQNVPPSLLLLRHLEIR